MLESPLVLGSFQMWTQHEVYSKQVFCSYPGPSKQPSTWSRVATFGDHNNSSTARMRISVRRRMATWALGEGKRKVNKGNSWGSYFGGIFAHESKKDMISGKPLLSATLHSHQIKAPKGASVTLGLTTTYNTEYGPIHTSKPTGSQNVAVSAYSKCAHFDFTQVPLKFYQV